MKLERILVPVDFSEMSHEAVASADRLATEVGGRLTLLYVHEVTEVQPVDYAYADAPRVDDKLMAAIDEQLKSWASECKTPADRVSTKIVQGSAVSEIIEASKDHDIVVMRTHGRSGLSHFMLGSVAERVVRGAKCSVFILKPPSD
jgi:nucleotide-binding universal stress UspA family protein